MIHTSAWKQTRIIFPGGSSLDRPPVFEGNRWLHPKKWVTLKGERLLRIYISSSGADAMCQEWAKSFVSEVLRTTFQCIGREIQVRNGRLEEERVSIVARLETGRRVQGMKRQLATG